MQYLDLNEMILIGDKINETKLGLAILYNGYRRHGLGVWTSYIFYL